MNKLIPDLDGISLQDISVALSFARRCTIKKLGASHGREPMMSEEVRKELEPILQLDVDFIKSWTPEQRAG